MAEKKLNSNLHKAKTAKKDEFYTQLTDIEKELKHYNRHFKYKVVYCNADDPFESQFFKYFALNFNLLGLKKLIVTSYIDSPIIGKQLSLFDIEGLKQSKKKQPLKIEINEVKDNNNDGAIDLADVEWLLKNDKNVSSPLVGDGDFRSDECIELLKQADIVVTNPPFSLFREYVAQLVKYDKKFVIVGNKNAITYKEIFKLIKENKLWVGSTPMSIDLLFDVSEDFAQELIENKKEGNAYKIIDGVVKGRSQSTWFTNLDHSKRHEDLILYRAYNKDDYPTYDNYDAINVDKTKDIPMDYAEAMGVPITFMDKYNPEQFEIIGLGISNLGIEIGVRPYKTEHRKYRKEVQKRGAVNGDLYMMVNGEVTVPYARIIIKNKKL